MNDQFLYQSKPEIDDEFAESLYKKINKRIEKPKTKQQATIWWIKRASVLLLLLTMFFILSPITWTDIQASAGELIQKLHPSSKLIGNIIVIDIPPALTAQPPEEPSGSVTDIPAIYIPIEEIKEKTSLEIDIPSWAPEGCVLNPKVLSWNGDIPSVHIIWNCTSADEDKIINLFITDAPMIAKIPSDSYDVVEVNNNSILIIRGIWASFTEIGNDRRWSMTEDMVRVT